MAVSFSFDTSVADSEKEAASHDCVRPSLQFRMIVPLTLCLAFLEHFLP